MSTKKIIKLNESDIANIVKNVIKKQSRKPMNEAYPEREERRKDTNFRSRDFEPYKRERDVSDVFGKYGEDVPPAVIQYMRKNPRAIIKRLYDIYGDKLFDYVNDVK